MTTVPISDSGATELAQNVYDILGDDFVLPEVDLTDGAYALPASSGVLHDDVPKLTNDDLTTGTINGDGAFDIILKSINTHLQDQYDKNRITGEQYSKAYIELTMGAMSTGTQYLLGRDQAYWSAVMTQAQAKRAEVEAVTAAVSLESAKAQLTVVRYGVEQAKAQAVLTKMQLATADVEFEVATYQLEKVLPEQQRQMAYQTDYILKSQVDAAEYNLEFILPAQRAGIESDTATKDYQRAMVIPAQKQLIDEQIEVQRAQTTDIRTDGGPVNGSVGKQKELYQQQIVSYQKDAQYKVAKMYLDSFLTQATLNDVSPPDEFKTDVVDTVFAKMRSENDLV